MAVTRTVNRQVTQVPVKGTDTRFFNHLEWHGLNNNKNAMGIDQMTFEDCNNVYVNTNNVLASRPPIVQSNQFNSSYGTIVNTWVFGDIQIIQTQESNNYFLEIVKDGASVQYNIPTQQNVKFVLVEERIFIFTAVSFQYFDINAPLVLDATQFIYIPRTAVITGGVSSAPEQPNVLTTSTMVEYIWSNASSVNFISLIGQQVQVQLGIGGPIYNVTFQIGMERIFVTEFSTFPWDMITMARDTGEFFVSYAGQFLYSATGLVFSTVLAPPVLNDGSTYARIKFANNGDSVLISSYTRVAQYNKSLNTWTILLDGQTTIDGSTPIIMDADSLAMWAIIVGNTLTYMHPAITGIQTYATGDAYDATYGQINVAYIPNVTAGTTDMIIFNTSTSDTNQNASINYRVTVISNTGVINSVGSQGLQQYVTPMRSTNCNMVSKVSGGKYEIWFTMLNQASGWIFAQYFVNNNLNGVVISNIVGTRLLGYAGGAQQSANNETYALIATDYSILSSTRLYLYFPNNIASNRYNWRILLFPATPVFNKEDAIGVYTNGKLYVTKSATVFIRQIQQGAANYMYFKYDIEFDNYFLTNDNTLYITDARRNDNGDFMWYIPDDRGIEKFNYPITNLHILSKNEVAIFFEREIWYATGQWITNPLSGLQELFYSYVKSKLGIGLRDGSQVITSHDGKFIIFSAIQRGLVALSFQDFISSTEQSLMFMSDNVQSTYDVYNELPVKLYQYKFWFVAYQEGNKQCYVFDTRNSSWWKFTFKRNLKTLTTYLETPTILAEGILHNMLSTWTTYADDSTNIDWFIKSQLLHFNAINNYKHILNLTLNSVETDDTTFKFGLICRNLRQQMNERKIEVFEYDIDLLRTFIKKLNFAKVQEFQYIIKSQPAERAGQLALTDLTIKFGVKEKVR